MAPHMPSSLTIRRSSRLPLAVPAGDQSHTLKARAAFHVSIVQPVIVGMGHVDGPIPADDLAEGKTERGVEHGGVNADIFEKLDPAVGTDFVKGAGLKVMQVGRMKMVERRKWIEERVVSYLARYAGGMYSIISLQSSITWPSPSIIVCPFNAIKLSSSRSGYYPRSSRRWPFVKASSLRSAVEKTLANRTPITLPWELRIARVPGKRERAHHERPARPELRFRAGFTELSPRPPDSFRCC